MPYQPPQAEHPLLAKLLPNASVSLEQLRSSCQGFSRGQIAFMRLYGKHFTAPELAILFERKHYSISTLAARLDVKLQKPILMREGESAPKPSLLAPLKIGARAQLGRNNGSGIGSSSRPKRLSAPYQMPESLRNYRPAPIDLDLGWWLNNAILHRMGLKKLGPDGCSWIEGDPHVPGWHFCGAPRVRRGGHVYCEAHAVRIYQAKPKQETEDGGDQEANGSAGAGVDDKAGIQQDAGGTGRRTRGGGRSGDECRERVQKAEKAGHKSRSYSFGKKTKGVR